VVYEPIALSAESTVVAEFVPEPAAQAAYQSEADLERTFLALLVEQAYEYLPVRSEADLIANLRVQLEALNQVTFTDGEWQRFFTHQVASANDGIVEKTTKIQSDHVQVLKRDDGRSRTSTCSTSSTRTTTAQATTSTKCPPRRPAPTCCPVGRARTGTRRSWQRAAVGT
jgi:type I restriction enzyme R subunit